MNLLLLILIIVSSVFINAKETFELKIEKITFNYLRAAELLENQEFTTDTENSTAFISDFFNQTGLYNKRAIKKFTQALNSIKKLATKKNLSTEQVIFANLSLLRLEKIQKFIIEHASTHYADKVYNEIEVMYHYIDEQNENIIDIVIEKPWLLHIPTTKNRNLYHFVKKINLDIRRLTDLTTQNNVSCEMLTKINELLTKISTLKEKIIETSIYKQQLRRTRWLKACGIVFVPMVFYIPFVLAFTSIEAFNIVITISALLISAPMLGLLSSSFIVSVVTTVQDIKEAKEYEIPVEARSIFSLVSWQGWIIQIGISLPLIIFAII